MKKTINSIHEMYEMKNFSSTQNKQFKRLQIRRFYELTHIIRNVHFVSTNQKRTKFYVNNYID